METKLHYYFLNKFIKFKFCMKNANSRLYFDGES